MLDVLTSGVKIRNSEPGATFKEFVEKWPMGIASPLLIFTLG